MQLPAIHTVVCRPARLLARWACPLLLAAGMVSMMAGQAAAEPNEDGITFFEKSIRPLLVKHCYSCHSAEAESQGKLQAGLSLDTKEAMLTGGESGPVIVPGKPNESLLIEALKYESYEMPPSGKLSAEEIDLFVKWVEMGAPDPRVASGAPKPRRSAFEITEQDRQHWAFQPVQPGPPPQVEDTAWVKDDIDRYVLAKLHQAGLSPAPAADKYTLLRRTTYALTGLPPTPEEIAAFVADERPDAFERVVDRLLASPEFGEHWGRRWLDGVRYATDVDRSGEYRKWVIQAYNNDLPYDQFIKLQLAGDLMPAQSVGADRVHSSGASLDGIAATGMLSLAVWEIVGRDLAVAEIVDSQIDLVGRQLLGLTLACARCHDHKFDPISTKDYYALAGIFFSTRIATGKLVADGRLGNDLTQMPLLSAEEEAHNLALDEAAAKLEEQIAAIEKKIPQAARLVAVKAELKEVALQIEKAATANNQKLMEQQTKLQAEQEKLLADQREKGWDDNPEELKEIAALKKQINKLLAQKVNAPSAVAVMEGGVPGSNREGIGDAPVYLRGEYQREGEIVPRRFPVILAGESQTPIGQRTQQSGRLELAEWITSPDNPLTARVEVNRIWQRLIGRGLVRSPDNFGRLGEPPTHPELLDHLAHRFVKSGWSVKQLVRAIVLSSTYQQSSAAAPEVAKTDPENVHLARMNRHRLTYEELRDSLLVVADRLADGPKAAKGKEVRTIYLPLERRRPNDLATILDGPDPKAIVPVRAETTTAPQALFLMNNEMAAESARVLAAKLEQDESLTDEQRAQRLWLTLLSRPPAAEETQLALAFVADYSWERFIHALLCTNEFAYLD
jgi:cytochrome c553